MNLDPSNIATNKDKTAYLYWILAIVALVLCINLGSLELSAEEPRRAIVAWEMLKSGDFIVPQAYGLEYYNKPPLFHWILAAFMSMFGTSEFIIRLPGILSFLGIAVMLYLYVKKAWPNQQAMLPAIAFLSSADLLLYATVFSGEIDLFFTLIILYQTIGIYYIGRQPRSMSGYFMAYSGLLFAVLTKGWSAFHFHVLTLIFWTIYQQKFKSLLNKRHILAASFFLCSICLYYYLFSLSGNLSNLLLNNFIESGAKVASTSFSSILNQLTETPFVLLKISLPWTLLLFFLANRNIRTSIKVDPILVFSIIFIISNVWIYWLFIDIRDRYLYPFIPFLCILLAGILIHKKWWPSKQRLLLIVTLIMIALRLLYNLLFIPRIADDRLPNSFVYRELVDSILVYSEGNKIDLLTPAASYNLPFAYQHIKQIDKQPIIPYQIPYYLIQKTNHAPRLVEEIIPGNYYLVVDSQYQLIHEHDSLFLFREQWYQQNLVLLQGR